LIYFSTFEIIYKQIAIINQISEGKKEEDLFNNRYTYLIKVKKSKKYNNICYLLKETKIVYVCVCVYT